MPQIITLDDPPGNWDLQNNNQEAAHFRAACMVGQCFCSCAQLPSQDIRSMWPSANSGCASQKFKLRA